MTVNDVYIMQNHVFDTIQGFEPTLFWSNHAKTCMLNTLVFSICNFLLENMYTKPWNMYDIAMLQQSATVSLQFVELTINSPIWRQVILKPDHNGF